MLVCRRALSSQCQTYVHLDTPMYPLLLGQSCVLRYHTAHICMLVQASVLMHLLSTTTYTPLRCISDRFQCLQCCRSRRCLLQGFGLLTRLRCHFSCLSIPQATSHAGRNRIPRNHTRSAFLICTVLAHCPRRLLHSQYFLAATSCMHDCCHLLAS